MCSIYREMKLYHYLQIRLIKPTVKGFLVYMRIMVCNEKSCTLLPSGIWLICILFVSLNFFLFPHGMWVIFFFVCASVGLWMTCEQVLISAGYSTSRKAWAVKQGHASKGLRDLALASNLRDHSLISCIACPLTCQPTRNSQVSLLLSQHKWDAVRRLWMWVAKRERDKRRMTGWETGMRIEVHGCHIWILYYRFAFAFFFTMINPEDHLALPSHAYCTLFNLFSLIS